jgi:Tol biopolymer transport system component
MNPGGIMKFLSLENKIVRLFLTCVFVLLGLAVASASVRAQEFVTAGNTLLFDVSADGQLLLQRDGFSMSGTASTNMSVLNLSTNQADPVNYNENGSFVNTVTGSMSGDGRYVAFQSGNRNIYLRDRTAGTSVNIIKTTDGQPANGDVAYPRISADGRYVLFLARATNLVTETLPATTAFTSNMFLYDRVTGQISLPARGADGALLGSALGVTIGLPANQISADGRYLVFVAGAPNVHPDVPASLTRSWLYRRDLQTGEVVLLSRDSAGNVVVGNYSNPTISNDGNHVGFTAYSLEADLAPGKREGGIYIKEVSSGKVTHMSESKDGKDVLVTGLAGNFSSRYSMSGDGQHVAFGNQSQNLLAGNPGGGWAIFLSSIGVDGTVSMRRISLPDASQQQTNNNEGTNPIFARGRLAVAFQSRDRRVFFPGISPANAPVMYIDNSQHSGPGAGPETPPTVEPLPRKTERVDGRPSTAVISGSVFDNSGARTERLTAPARLSIKVAIAPEPADIGQALQILVVVEVAGTLLTLNSSGEILPFDESNLQFFSSRASASAKEEIELFNGELGVGDRAAYNIFVGYLRSGDLNQGNIIYNAEPVSIVIE